MAVFVNRVLNLKKIKAIGFDMDYTLVEYQTENFEELVFNEVLKSLVNIKNYPKKILDLEFNFDLVIQGLVLDKEMGNALKLSRFGKVKKAFHGKRELSFSETQKVYQKLVIDLNDPNIQSLDTSFSISNGVLFLSLVEEKNNGLELPSFYQMAKDIKEMIDLVHRDGTLKNEVKKNPDHYLIKNPETVELLENLKKDRKKILLITNSEYSYTKTLMEYAFNPFLKSHKDWKDLFDVSITLSQKPRFFTENSSFLKVDPKNGMLSNYEGNLQGHIFQGGNADQLEKDLKLDGDEILYLGDHIFGDIVSIKKSCNWRTALVLAPIKQEIDGIRESLPIQTKIDELMAEKVHFELEYKQSSNKELFSKIEELNKQISEKIMEKQSKFNPYWGELMRAGAEESRFADQLEKYSCIYMERVSDLLSVSSQHYFRPMKRLLPHELII